MHKETRLLVVNLMDKKVERGLYCDGVYKNFCTVSQRDAVVYRVYHPQ